MAAMAATPTPGQMRWPTSRSGTFEDVTAAESELDLPEEQLRQLGYID